MSYVYTAIGSAAVGFIVGVVFKGNVVTEIRNLKADVLAEISALKAAIRAKL